MELYEDGIKIEVQGLKAEDGYNLAIIIKTNNDIITTDFLRKMALQFFHLGTTQNTEEENKMYLSVCNILYPLSDIQVKDEQYCFEAVDPVHNGKAVIRIIKN